MMHIPFTAEISPLPWSVYEDVPRIAAATECFTESDAVRPYPTAGLTDSRGDFRNPADAAFIVKAVNNHDALMRLVERAVIRIKIANDEGDDSLSGWLKDAVKALAQVEKSKS